jgi:hypothetical protein
MGEVLPRAFIRRLANLIVMSDRSHRAIGMTAVTRDGKHMLEPDGDGRVTWRESDGVRVDGELMIQARATWTLSLLWSATRPSPPRRPEPSGMIGFP